MKQTRLLKGLFVVSTGVSLAAVLWWSLPQLVGSLPGRVRYYLPEVLIAAVITPLPTALPAPVEPPLATIRPESAAAAVIPTAISGSGDGLSRSVPAESPATPTPSATPPMAALPSPTPVARPPTAVASRLPEAIVEPTATPLPLPARVRIDAVPIIPQKFNNCGPTNLTLVLNHYGVGVDQFDVAAIVRPNYEDRNVSPDELARYVQAETDLAAAVYVGGDFEMLRRLLAAGFPVIVEIGFVPDPSTGWMGHYLTLFGYDDTTGHFLVRDTYLGPWKEDGLMSYEKLAEAWLAFNHTFMVVHRPAAAADLWSLLPPALIDSSTMWSHAVAQAHSAIDAEPHNPFAWFNLGASLTNQANVTGELDRYESAAAAFDQARRLGLPPRMLWYQFVLYEAYLAVGRPEDVLLLAEVILSDQGGRQVEETYLNQGHALRMVGEEAAARRAFRRVIDLNPGSVQAAAAHTALVTPP